MKNLTKCFAACVVLFVLLMVPSSLFGQTDSIIVRYGNNHADQMDVDLNQHVTVGMFVWTNGEYVADINLVLGTSNQYVDSLLGQTEGELFSPLTEWQICEFSDVHSSPPNPEGWSSQALFGWARYSPDSDAPWLRTVAMTRVANFVVKTALDSLNIGDDAIAIGPGLTPTQGPSNAGDTLGGVGFMVHEEFSWFHFIGGGYVEGTISDTHNSPIEGVNVTVEQTGKTTYSDAEGFYHIGHYPMNGLTFTFTHPEYQSFSTDVDVTADQTETVDVTLHRLGIISGTILNASDQPIAGVLVSTGELSTVTSDDGTYSLTGLDPGTYNVNFTHADYVDTLVTGVSAQIDVVTTLDLVMHQLGGITGTVTDTTGTPIEGVLVELVGQGEQTNTNAGGGYTLDGIAPGTYSLRFTHPDYDSLVVNDVVVAYDVMTTVNASLDPGTGIDDDYNRPLDYSLRQNYPNPFNAETSIEYSIPKDAYVSLEIYDLLGRRVAVLVNQQQPAGIHKVTWNAGSMTSGMYFYRIQAGDFNSQKSMMLLK